MKMHLPVRSVFAAASLAAACVVGAQSEPGWKTHSLARPNPPVITPATASTPDQPGKAPSDAVILFDGKDLSQWRSTNGGPAKWIVKDGVMESVKGAGYIQTYRNFGDCQLHIEWAAPVPPSGSGQGRGNSGVFLMNQYEIQVLDSYQNRTYADGQTASAYGQHPPLVNAALPPGQWQTYDIIFYAPRFDATGNVTKPATVTILHNGVLVQSNTEFTGPTGWLQRAAYRPHPLKLPLALQDHGNPVRYRNIWIRELFKPDEVQYTLATETLDGYVGRYKIEEDFFVIVTRQGSQLYAQIRNLDNRPIFAASDTRFFLETVAIELEFHPAADGKADRLSFRVGGDTKTGKRL
jgi:hypothetical protein